jgi:hypothetical protein
VSVIKSIQPDDAKRLFGNLSKNNHYQVDFSSLTTFKQNSELLNYLKNERKVDANFIQRDAGFLCYEASLPGTSLATAEVKDNFMGVSQEFAHTRLYTDFDFSFYVDDNYNAIRFFEGWIDFISSGSETLAPIGDGANPLNSNYYRRMRYPDTYKCQTMTITKFEKNFDKTIKYTFVNAFPKTVSAIPVTYGAADILRVTVSFNYDRYLIDSDSVIKGTKGNFIDLADTQPSAELQARRAQITRVEQPKQNPPANSTAVNNLTPTAKGLQEVAETGGGVSRQYAIDRLVKSRGMSYRDAAIEVKKIYGD